MKAEEVNGKKVTLTVVTATYNRADCLKVCYASLKAQTSYDFQWLIVDDGSSDNTEETVKSFMEDCPAMDIEYRKKENGGKHSAINYSHGFIRGKYCIVLDSDDTFIPTAVETIIEKWKKYESNPEVGQIIFLKGYSEDEPICTVLHEDVVVDTVKEKRIGKDGRDCADSFKTELFIKHKFPVFDGEKFIGEGSATFFIELESKGVYFNKVIYLCAYREDGLTKAGKKMRILNPRGGMFNSKVYMHRKLPLKTRLKKAVLYVCYSKFAKMKFGEALKESGHRFLVLLAAIPGWCLYLYWKKKYLKNGKGEGNE